jgi:mannose-6-phosphate isomerase-like protein (cupin superfamily)
MGQDAFMGSGIVARPWGSYRTLGQWSKITVKVLKINPNSRISLQKHEHRDEEWTCLSGRAHVTVGKRSFTMNVGDKTLIPRKKLHRVSSLGGAEILEVTYGEFDENDIVRVKDDYGRVR